MAEVNFNFEDHSPEQRLIMAILYSYLEDVDTLARRKQGKLTRKFARYNNVRPDYTLDELMYSVSTEHTRMLCELINLDYDFFCFKFKEYVWQLLNERV